MRIHKLIVFLGAVYLAASTPVLASGENGDTESARISAPTMPFSPPLTTDFYGGRDNPEGGSESSEKAAVEAPVEASYSLDEVFFVCGDHRVDPNEECDDGNRRDFDGCSSLCFYENDFSCGNGKLETGESCDDGNQFDGDGCSSRCQLLTVCSDGIVNGGEECDDGNTTPGDGCSQKCMREEKIVFQQNDERLPADTEKSLQEPQKNLNQSQKQQDRTNSVDLPPGEIVDELDLTDTKTKVSTDKKTTVLVAEDGDKLEVAGDTVLIDSMPACTAGETVFEEVSGRPVFSGEQKSCSGSCSVRIEYDKCTGAITGTTALTSTFSVTGGTYSTSSGVYQCQSGAPTVVTYDASNETTGGSASFQSRAVIVDCKI